MMEENLSVHSSLAPGATGQSTLASALNADQVSMEDQGERTLDETMDDSRSFSKPRPNGFSGQDLLSIEQPDPQPLPNQSTRLTDVGEWEESVGNSQEVALSTEKESNQNHASFQRTGYVYSVYMQLHAHPATKSIFEDSTPKDSDDDESMHSDSPHPEQPERIRRIFNVLRKNGCLEKMKRIPIREITRNEVILVHDQALWDGLQRSAFFTPETLAEQLPSLERESLYINEHTALCARLSCGGVVEMCDAVANGQVQNGFAIVRPPGHHAEPSCSMGFCLYNNVAVAAAFLKQKYGERTDQKRCKRILILDWDVHHGNGTQKAFWDDKDVLYISLHRHDGNFYPGGPDGGADRIGAEGALGRNVNIPWPSDGMGDTEYLYAFQRIVMPIAIEFSPDFVIISAGFDAARGDQLGGCDVTPEGYAHMAYELARLANGRLVVALEGGYNVDSIAQSALHVTRVLLGSAPGALESDVPACDQGAHYALEEVEHIQSPYWKCMSRRERCPEEGDELLTSSTLAEMLEAHRVYDLSAKYGLVTLPTYRILHDQQDSVVGMQQVHCMCTPDVFRNTDTPLVLFAHDLGNIRMQLPWMSSTIEDRDLLRIVGANSQVVKWALNRKMKLIDVNVNAESRTEPSTTDRARRQVQAIRATQEQDAVKQTLLELWDNVIQEVDPLRQGDTKVILIGFGSACASVMHLIEERAVRNKVIAIAQFPYHESVPMTRRDSLMRKWYFSHSRVYVPHNHLIFRNEQELQTAKRYGKIVRSSEQRAAHVLTAEFGKMIAFVNNALSKQSQSLQANSHSNGSGKGHGQVRDSVVEPSFAPQPVVQATSNENGAQSSDLSAAAMMME